MYPHSATETVAHAHHTYMSNFVLSLCRFLVLAAVLASSWTRLTAELPTDWSSADIGTVAATGTASLDSATGVYTVQGSGASDIGGTSDHFHFAYRSLSGDGQIIARIASLTNTNAWAKAGVMIRESIDGNSKHALMMVTPTSGTGMKWRGTTGGSSTQVMVTGAAPRWLKLERRGNMITGFESTDGVAWRVVQRVALSMSADTLVGFAVCSRANGLTTMSADHVLIDSPDPLLALPWPWTEQTVGNPLEVGAAVHDGSFVLSNLGADIAGTADRMKYVSQTLIGDGTLTVKVASVTSADNASRFGLMMRESLDANARTVLLGLTTSRSVSFMSRRTIGGSIASRATGVTVAVPAWLRLERQGNVFSAWRSADGVNWTFHGSETLELGPTLHVGLAYSNRSTSTWAIGVGDELQLTSPADLDGNGLPDSWETHYFSGVGVDPHSDPDGDGLTNAQEWALGNDPLVFNLEGQRPLLAVVSGNHQSGFAGTVLSQSLVVRVTDSLTGNPLANVPVQLRVTRGEGALGSVPPGTSLLGQFSDSAGLVQSPFLLPATAGLSIVEASVGGGSQAAAVTFSLNSRIGEEPLLFDLTDLGTPTIPGKALYSQGTYTLTGATIADNGSTADQSTFVWRNFTGDGYILARVDFIDVTNSYGQAGLMMRETLDAESANVSFVLTKGQGIAYQWRDTPGAATGVNRKTGVYGPVWLLLRRQGDSFNALYSTDGVAWKPHGSRTVVMGETIKVGLTLGTRGTIYQSATFDNLRQGAFSDAPWSAADIGLPRATAVDDYAGDSIFVRAGGLDIAGNADNFHYVYQPLIGDGSLVARVASQLAVKTTTKSALMIRESLEPGSRYVALTLMPTNGLTLRKREQTDGATTTSSAIAATAPHWLRIDRLGPNIVAHASADGLDWTQVASVAFAPGATPLIGLAASSNDTGNHTQTLFDHLRLDMADGSLGWNGAYYEGGVFDTLRALRRDTVIDFAWPAGQSPAPGVPASGYSVRWQADVMPTHSETYTFTTLSQGSVRVLVNGQPIIDRWTAHALDETAGSIALTTGQPVRVVVEYANTSAQDARVRLNWSSPSQPDEPVPFTAVRAIDSDDDGMSDAWELAHGFNPHNPADAALDGDDDGLSNLEEYQLGGNPHAADDRLPGAVLMETWTGVSGKAVRDFTKHAKFHEAPSARTVLTRLDAPRNIGDNYGRRIRGYVVPPATGDYRFHLAADESAELWLATDDTPFTRVKIARVGLGVTAHQDYSARVEQHSWPITLHAGQHYYFEVLHKENTGSDHFTVAWTVPGSTVPSLIGGAHLAQFTGHPDDLDGNGLPDAWETAQGLIATPALPLTSRGSYNDADGDRLINLLEYQHGTQALTPDTDTDGTDDFLEALVGHDPLTVSSLDLLPWTLADIGHVNTNALAVAARVGPAAYALAGTGSGMTLHKADGYRFLYREVTGDFEFTTRIARPATSPTGYAGVAIRASLDPHATGMTLLQDVDGLNRTFVRIPGHIYQLPSFTPPFASEATSLSGYWFRLRRTGDLVRLYYSADGAHWVQSAAKTLPLPDACFVGMAIAHDMGPGVGSTETEVPVRRFRNVSLVTDLSPPASPETVPPDATVTPIATINGNAGVSVIGQWSADANGIVSQTFTGTLDYTFTVPADGLYRLTFTANSPSNPTTNTLFPVVISVDGQFVARVDLVLPVGEDGLARVITPWLTAGTHTVRLFYDNTLSYRPLRIRSLDVELLGGLDADGNGRADWIEARLQELNALNAGDGELYVSPASLSGLARHRSLFALAADGLPVAVNPAPGFGWYADIALDEASAVEVVGDFENSGLVQGALLTWKPLNLLAVSTDDFPQRHIRVRKGDRLRLTAHPLAATDGGGVVTVAKPDTTSVEHALADAVAQPVAHTFDQAGTYTINATYTDGSASAVVADAFTVEVIEAVFASDPIAGLNNTPVTWDNPLIFDNVLLEVDHGVLLAKQSDLPAGGIRFVITTANVADSYIIARLGENGPVFGHATVRSVRVATISDTAIELVQVYPDGSQLISVPVVVNNLTDHTRVEVEIFIQGVTFEDGTIVKTLTKTHFDQYGRAFLKFIYPPGLDGSICHRVHVYEGKTYLGMF